MDLGTQAATTAGPRRSARLRRLRGQATRLSDIQSHPETRFRPAPRPDLAITPVDIDGSGNESISDDELCPICQLLLYRPVRTVCNHTLCEFCMAHWADVSVTSQMKIVDVDEEPTDFDPILDLEAKCPMCRTQTHATFDPELAQYLRAKYPKTWAERQTENEADAQIERSNNGGDSIQTITVYVGNRHKLVRTRGEDENEHEWTFFVKPSRTDIIEEVQILLHPTFNPSRIVRTRSPYKITRWGWGTFTITAYVILKAGYVWLSTEAEDTPDGASKGMLPLEWTLDFDGVGGNKKGSMGRLRLKVKNDRGGGGNNDDGRREREEDEREFNRMVRGYQRDGDWVPPPPDSDD